MSWLFMDTPIDPLITHVERLSGSVVVTFADGKCVLFSASLLYATISKAEYLTDLPNPDDE
jgi:hypothetical protein